MHRVPEPNVRELLLPILSFLPVAFVSGKPPPDFLPLLSPILRQRVHLRSTNCVASPHDPTSTASNWLSLLTWSPSLAKELVEVCSELHLEPHPVSGELELFDDEEEEEAGKIQYRKLDSETFQARCDLIKYSLAVIWLWCENDDGSVGLPVGSDAGEVRNGWKVAEVLPLNEDGDKATSQASQWHASIVAAEEAYSSSPAAQNSFSPDSRLAASLDHHGADARNTLNSDAAPGTTSNTSGEDDYWALYDRTPDQTPQKSPAPPTPSNAAYPGASNIYNPAIDRRPSASVEADYYARYGSVQPALDAHDPDEEEGTSGFESTLRHTNQERAEELPTLGDKSETGRHGRYNQERQHEGEEPPLITATSTVPLRMHSPTPSRPSTSSSGRRSPVENLEASATSSSAAEVGVKQHISTELKSLFRLARAAGIDRAEFERVVRTELDVLGMMEV